VSNWTANNPHFDDLRHTGKTLAAQSVASLADLKTRMGHHGDRQWRSTSKPLATLIKGLLTH
jgi:hypothetical protein